MTHEEKKDLIIKRLGMSYFDRINEKTDDQLDYVLSSINENIFLKACPGSGKTEVVGLKAAFEIQNWERNPGGIAVLTFTNNAAYEIRERVSQFIGNKKATYPHFIGTIDSWLHNYLVQPFGSFVINKAIDRKENSFFLISEFEKGSWLYPFALKTKYYFIKKSGQLQGLPLFPNMIRYNLSNKKWEIKNLLSESNVYVNEDDFYNNEAFNLFRKDKSWLTLDFLRKSFAEAKVSFLKKGFATYADMEFLAYLILSNGDILCRVAKRFPFIIIDECQDLSYEQIEILKKLKGAGTIIHLIGDLNQSIYEFKKVDPDNIEYFVVQKKFSTKTLTLNHRSCQNIIELYSKLVRYERITGNCVQLLNEPCIYFSYNKNEMHKLAPIFQQYLIEKGLNVDKSVIITRNWNSVNKLKQLKIHEKDKDKYQFQLATSIYLWQKKDKISIENSIRLLGKFIYNKYFSGYSANSQRYFCPDCVNSVISWRIFLANILDIIYKNNKSLVNLNHTWKNWSSIIRKEFMGSVKECLKILNGEIDNDILKKIQKEICSFDAPIKMGDQNVLTSLTIAETTAIDIQVMTIHSVKGQTFDAVLLVSSPSQSGTDDGHWTDWLENKNSEAARLAYVASSRPRYLLAWAVPEPTNDDMKRIEDLGFKKAII